MKMKKNQIVLIRVVSVAVLMAALALILIFGAGSTVFTKIIKDLNNGGVISDASAVSVYNLVYYKGMNAIYQIIFGIALFTTIVGFAGVFFRIKGTDICLNTAIIFDVVTGVYLILAYVLEKNKFNKTLEKGLREFEKLTRNIEGTEISKDIAFKLYDTYGFPIELTEELAKEQGLTVDIGGFKKKFEEHQALSRKGAEQKFKGGLASTGEMETKYHTATHLLNAALKKVLGSHVHQKGSNITAERMRFDFSHDSKMTPEEKQQTEDLVNEYIKMAIPVEKLEMPKEEAIKMGAECEFIERYPDIVTVYKIGDVSTEICGGPHVSNTSELGKFKIKKEESSSAGVRRIKAVLIEE